MNRQVLLIFWGVIAAAMLGTSGALAKYYFTFDPNNIKAVKDTKELIYDKVQASWLTPDLLSMHKKLGSPEMDQYEQMILRTALGRWRVRTFAPHAYRNLLRSYRCGLWDDGFVDGLTLWLKDLDSNWVKARQEAIQQSTVAGANLASASEQGLTLFFSSGTVSSSVGSLIDLYFTVGPNSTPQTSVDVHWETLEKPGITPDRCRLVFMESTSEGHNNLPVYKISIDMSDEPSWLQPDSHPTIFYIRPVAPVYWNPVRFEFKDSPLLPIGLKD